MWYATIKGSAFLWHQVRCMMGIIFLIGKGLEDVDIIDKMLDTSLDLVYNYEIASDMPLILSDCQFEGVKFTNTHENYADNFFSLSKIYEQNLIATAMNTFFLHNITGLFKSSLSDINKIHDEGEVVDYLEKKYKRKKNYTKLLNHKHNRKNNIKN